MNHPVSRVEIAEAVRPFFDQGGGSREQLVEHATAHGVRPQVIQTLHRLSDKRYNRMNELWEYLAEVPVEV